MSISDAQFTAWLKSSAEIRCVLVEADVKLSAGGSSTRYLSNKAYVSAATDTPANTPYSPRICGGIKFTKSLSVQGTVSMSFGDIEILNTDGELDDWVDDCWAGRQLRVYLGDPTWQKSDFRLMFTGVITGVDCRSRSRINLKYSDSLQRLNFPVTEVKLGGTGSLADEVAPLCFGECHNISPRLVSEATNEYQVHQGEIESIIEVRDNGIPVSFTPYLSTGKFRLAAAPVGAVTCSVQGAKLQSPGDRLVVNSTFVGAPWQWGSITSMALSTAGGSPFEGAKVYALVANATNGAHQVYTGSTVTPGVITTAQAYIKPGLSRVAMVGIVGAEASSWLWVEVDFTTGVVTTANSGGYATGGGVTVSGHAERVRDGWWVLSITGSPDTTSVTRRIVVRAHDAAGNQTFAGDGTSTMIYASSPTLAIGQWPLSFGVNGEPTTGAVYRNNIVDIIRHIATAYGSTSLRLTDLDFDTGSMLQFQSVCMQPVGLYLADRSNAMDACNALAASVGGRLYTSGDGKVGLVRLDLAQGAVGNTVTTTDVVDKSMHISSLPQVVAAVKIAYCRNYTVQTTVAAGVPPQNAALYAEEWLTETSTDSAAATNYNLFVEPAQEVTNLLTAQDAAEEAQRRLDMFKIQRKIVKFTGQYGLIEEVLGGPLTIVNPRFGLSSGKSGQIVSIGVDLTSPRVDIEVLI